MSGRYSNGFDHLPTGASAATILALLELEGWYLAGPNFLSVQVPGRYGFGKAILVSGFGPGGTAFHAIRGVGGHNSAGGFIGIGLTFPVSFSGYWPVLYFYDAVNDTPLIAIVFKNNGIVAAYRGGGPILGGAFLGASDPGAYDMGTTNDFEVFGKVDNTTGEVEVRINKVSVLHLVSQDTQPGSLAYFDSYGWGWESQNNAPENPNFVVDDLRYSDTAGAINNTFLGTCRVQECLPASDGATLDFTRSNTGLANWQNISNLSVDDSLYLFDPTIGDYNLSGMAPLVNSPTVFWVGVLGFYRQDDATQRFVKNRISSSGVLADGASYATAQTYTGHYDAFELDPNTGLTFTGAAVNALQVGPLIYA